MLYKNSLKKNNLGFSLIELSLVLAVIGILLAGVFAGRKFINSSKVSNTKQALLMVDNELEKYRLQVGYYPSSLDELITGPSNAMLARRWTPSLQEKDLKDYWGVKFQYSPFQEGAFPPYDLYSIGKSGDSPIYSPVSSGQ